MSQQVWHDTIPPYTCADLEGGGGPGPLEFAKLNIADITGNEENSYFSYLCTSTVIRQTDSESILLKVGPPSPGKIFWIRACYTKAVSEHTFRKKTQLKNPLSK